MINLIKKIFAKLTVRKVKKDKLIVGKDEWIYFNNVDKCFKMTISSISYTYFTAKFKRLKDVTESRIIEDYNQYADDDIKFDKLTCEPIKNKN